MPTPHTPTAVIEQYFKVLHPLVPLRCEPSERAEMVSQLLYGECGTVSEVTDQWVKVVNGADDYTGWADRKMITVINKEMFARIGEAPYTLLHQPIAQCIAHSDNQELYLPMGSKLSSLDNIRLKEGSMPLFNEQTETTTTAERIVATAKLLLNAPYLWGGKSVMGIDCSGLVQLVYSVHGIQLPRDASQQISHGQILKEDETVMPGDLCFFQNPEGRIVHVGIAINKTELIHASGWVKAEPIHNCNHTIHSIRRLLPR